MVIDEELAVAYQSIEPLLADSALDGIEELFQESADCGPSPFEARGRLQFVPKLETPSFCSGPIGLDWKQNLSHTSTSDAGCSTVFSCCFLLRSII
jgi:hypothetical protein